MKSVDLNENWKIVTAEGESMGSLPYDALCGTARDYTCAFGELNGYFPAARATFTRELPRQVCKKAVLVISGACGYGDVYINGNLVCKLHSYAPVSVDITDFLIKMGHNSLRIDMFAAPGMSDKYTGLGIAGGVKLLTFDGVDIGYGSPFVTTSVIGGKTYADVTVSVHNDGPSAKLLLDCTVTNARGKRAGKKLRKVYIKSDSDKVINVKVRIVRAYEWSPVDPYLYGLHVKLTDAEGTEKTASVRFGIVSRSLNPLRGIYLNNRNTQLFGAYVSHADAAIGGVSNYSNERRRLCALKALGYNAVHFTECPTETTLDVLDDIGMYAYVDLFSHLTEGKAPLDGHIFNSDNISPNGTEIVYDSITVMRNHPCVTVYGVADDVPECYNRNDGHAEIHALASLIRTLDHTRPVTVSAHEFVPNVKELDDAGIKRNLDGAAAVNAGREKDLFNTLTEGAFDGVDICGFNNLYQLYGSERVKRGRLVMGCRTSEERAFESYEETEKNANVVGDFGECGIDYPGGGSINEIYGTRGDLDAICNDKPQGVLKSLILGARNVAYIAVADPDTGEPVHMWNWPRYLGQTVNVMVYTSGDVAALYLDGRIIGRKLAGKINRHIAMFKTEYYPGKLEAVCYYKGVECARATLKTAGSPKAIKLTSPVKNLDMRRGDLGFVYVDVCDREGDSVPYAMRNLQAQVTGGKLIAFINADPLLRKTAHDSCPAYGGKALAVVKPDAEGKTVVKITGEGLLSSRISFKAKD